MSRGPWNQARRGPAPVMDVADLPAVCTVADVARLLQCTGAYVSRIAAEGILPAFKLGNRWRFRRDDVRAYIDREVDAIEAKKIPLGRGHATKGEGILRSHENTRALYHSAEQIARGCDPA